MKSENVTNRWYDDACSTAHALELIGERWALLVIRELMFGGRRFADLRRGLPGISANVLTQRLQALAAAGVVARRTLPPPASVQVYELTSWGYEAEPFVQSLGRWAARSPGHDPTLPLSAASLMMSFRTMFASERAGEARLTIAFRPGRDRFAVKVEAGALAIERGEPDPADAVVTAAPEVVTGIVYGGRPIADATASGELGLEGDAAAFARFTGLFALPPKAVVNG
ncbi:winged helix-turn-helix transcriptional regulator [uncultured Sphingomonas sp.]|uniref:winged helix-turn-helix transcriptional regulator n=1 Tax=uncultured Sphingomonas sp. TaxID=158754 RepID=UPI0035CC6E40